MEPEQQIHKITTSLNELGYKTYKLRADEGYCFDVDVLAKAIDTGNGYIFRFPSYSSCCSDKYLNLDYDEIKYIAEIYKLIEEGV